ncbi:MAG: SRPBCC domain-containing protein [Chloroflexi bacterium]|nr:SRPBCC domain-containing protein [Chloroflexota bacterium]
MPVGKTKGQGWEIGVRRTFPIATDAAWELLMTQPGLGIWLGHGVTGDFKKGDPFTTDEQTVGEIRSYVEGSMVRMRWQPKGWDFGSTLQMRVLPAKRGATISIHHEKLENGEQREQMQRHWSGVLDQLEGVVRGDVTEE